MSKSRYGLARSHTRCICFNLSCAVTRVRYLLPSVVYCSYNIWSLWTSICKNEILWGLTWTTGSTGKYFETNFGNSNYHLDVPDGFVGSHFVFKCFSTWKMDLQFGSESVWPEETSRALLERRKHLKGQSCSLEALISEPCAFSFGH